MKTSHGLALVGCMISPLVLLAAFGTVSILLGTIFPESEEERAARESRQKYRRPSEIQFDAAFYCKTKVEERLRAPSTAKFPTNLYQSAKRTGTPNEYSVRSYVDAENAFGTPLRSAFSCTVEHVPSTDRWRLLDLTID